MSYVFLSLHTKQKSPFNSLALTLSQDTLKEKSPKAIPFFIFLVLGGNSEYRNNNQVDSIQALNLFSFTLTLFLLSVGCFLG